MPKDVVTRARRTWTGWLARSGATLFLLAAAALCFAWLNGWRPWPRTAPAVPVDVAAVPPRLPPRDEAGDAARRAARSVVALETLGAGDTRNLGAGFILSESGLIVTSFHVVSAATSAQARLPDGRVLVISGYAAASGAYDLAILQVDSPPTDLHPLPLAQSAEPVPAATPVFAIGHPRGVEFAIAAGRVSQIVHSSDLPDDARRFVRQLTRGTPADVRWLAHSAHLEEGNSGGPLLDVQGRVIGVNTWIRRPSGSNYAVEASYVRLLQQTVQPGRLTPLEKLARSDVRTAALVSRLIADRVQTLRRQADAMRWMPASTEDYSVLQELAVAMTAAHLPQSLRGDKADIARGDALHKAVTQLEEELKGQQGFGSHDQITFVNEYALQQVEEPHAGVFAFIEVERVVSGDNGARGLLAKLIGSERSLFVSLDAQFFSPSPGEVYAVFGVHLPNEFVRYGDNPLRLTVAPVILSKSFVKAAQP